MLYWKGQKKNLKICTLCALFVLSSLSLSLMFSHLSSHYVDRSDHELIDLNRDRVRILKWIHNFNRYNSIYLFCLCHMLWVKWRTSFCDAALSTCLWLPVEIKARLNQSPVHWWPPARHSLRRQKENTQQYNFSSRTSWAPDLEPH